jgi:uncharacterized protein involved in outer membrane biogenesis
VAAVILAVVGAGIALLPELSRRLAVSRLQSLFRMAVEIEDVDLNLFTGKAAIEHLVIGADESRPVLSLPFLSIDFSRLGLLTGQIDLQVVYLKSPKLVLERLGPTTYNLVEALERGKKTPQADDHTARGLSFAIQRLEIDGGEVAFIDRTQEPDYQATFTSLDLTAGPIQSLPESEVTPTNFAAAVQIAGGKVKIAGSSTLFGKTLETQVTVEASNVELASFNAYLPYGARLNLQQSSLNGEAKYVLAYRQQKPAEHSIAATLKVGSIALLPAPGARPIMQFASLTVRNFQLDFLQNEGQVGALVIHRPYLLLRRDSAGLNLQQFTPANATGRAGGDPDPETSEAMPFAIKQLTAEGGTIEFIDETVSPVAETAIQSLALAASDVVVVPEFATAQITAHGRLGKGSLELTGDVDNEPLRGQFTVTGKQIPFEPLRGYIDQIFNSANSSGDHIGGQLKVMFAPDDKGDIATSMAGKLEGHNLSLQFPDAQDPFLTTSRLGVELREIRIDENVRFDVGQIAFTGANLQVLRGKDGGLNLTRLWASQEQETSSPSEQQRNGGETAVAIQSITVNESAIAILDHSVSPNYTTKVAKLRGKVSQWVPNAKRADLEFEGILGDTAKLQLSGWFTPFSEKPYVKLQAAVRGYALPPLNPYATEYISHRIRQGQVTTNIDYTLKGDGLQATAEIVLRDLRVGEKTGDQFAQQIGIPLELAVALLQDVGGVIRLQVAMDSETGPKVNIRSLIWRAVRNAIVKAITTPFRLVGNILTLGGRIGELRIEPLFFEPGTSELQEQSQKQLEQLARLLERKPRLELKLNGNVTRSELDVLRQERFWEKIQRAKAKNYEEALVQVYRELGGVTQPALPLAPRAEESLEQFVLERIDITDEELKTLASERAEIVQRQLETRGIDPQRLSASAAQSPLAANRPTVDIEILS